MQRLLPSLLLSGLCLLAACAAPAPTTGGGSDNDNGNVAYVPDDAPEYGPGDTCADTYVLLYDNARTNFSLGSSNYQNEDFCGAYPYLRWLVDNEPLFTGEEPDDRNFLRLASTYEFFASKADSTVAGERKAYLDSALTTRQAGRDAMDAAGIAYDSYLRDLREGFFHYSYALDFPESETEQFAAFRRAFDARPDSLEDWYIQQLFNQSSLVLEEPAERSAFVRRLADAADALDVQQYYASFADFLVRPPDEGEGEIEPDAEIQRLLNAYADRSISDDDTLVLLAVALRQPERISDLGGDPVAIAAALVRSEAVIRLVTTPGTLIALSRQAFERGDAAEGTRLFDRSIENEPSAVRKASYYADRIQRGNGEPRQLVASCLRYNPANAYCLFTQAGLVGDEVGRVAGTTPQGRAAYWCMADRYRSVAAVSTNAQITRAAREAATGYERAAPTREQYFFSTDWRPGDTVTASLGSYGTCTTRVR